MPEGISNGAFPPADDGVLYTTHPNQPKGKTKRSPSHRIGNGFSQYAAQSMDGWATLAALRDFAPDIPVILTSGYYEARVMQIDHAEQP